MAASYILNYSDPNNLDSILVTSTTDGPGKNTTSTSLELVGAGYQNYGLPTAQNFLKLLENFAGPDQPIHPIKGQLWYDTSNPNKPVLRVNNGQITSAKWPSANGIYQQTSDPIVRYAEHIVEGDIWVDTSTNQLKIRFSNEWTVVGPSVQVGTTKTGSEAVTVETTAGGDPVPIIKNWVNGKVVEIISYNAFTPRTVIEGFATIKIGTNLTTRVAAKYNGLAEKASALEVSSGVLIQASEVLKNNAATQTLAGALYIQSANGLYVRPNATSDTVRIYSDLTNAAYVNYTNTSSAATLRVGITTSSYLKFNSGYASIGINKSPTASSPTLDVNGGGRFLNTLTVTDSSAIALSIGGGASFGGEVSSAGLAVSGTITGTGKLTLGGVAAGTIIEPTTDDIYEIGSPSKRFTKIYVSDVHATSFIGDVIGSAERLSTPRSFNVQGQVTATSVLFNGTTTTNFVTSLTRTAITDQPYTSTTEDTQTLLILNTSTTTSSLEQISKADFLSNVYPNLFVTGMITAFGTSTNLPSGFLLCDNTSVLITSYPTLYSVIGTHYGTGGPGTFRTPNMSVSTAIAGAGYVTYIIKT